MKSIAGILLVLFSVTAFAQRPECSYIPGGCVGNPPGLDRNFDLELAGIEQFNEVPEPGTSALLALGFTGLLIFTRRRK